MSSLFARLGCQSARDRLIQPIMLKNSLSVFVGVSLVLTGFAGAQDKKDAKKEDGSEMNDKEKRKAALDKARKYQESRRKKKED